jgi:hypothetical protein
MAGRLMLEIRVSGVVSGEREQAKWRWVAAAFGAVKLSQIRPNHHQFPDLCAGLAANTLGFLTSDL